MNLMTSGQFLIGLLALQLAYGRSLSEVARLCIFSHQGRTVLFSILIKCPIPTFDLFLQLMPRRSLSSLSLLLATVNYTVFGVGQLSYTDALNEPSHKGFTVTKNMRKKTTIG